MFLAKYLPFFLLLGAAMAWKSDKECNLKEVIGKCIKSDFQIESADKKQKNLPKNAEEMNTFCDNEKKAEECVSAENLRDKCTENEKEKKALDHSLDGMVRVVKRVCQNDASKNEFAQHSEKCGNAVLQDGRHCLNDFKRHLIAANNLNDKDKIRKIMCCKIKEVPRCIHKSMKEKGNAVCSEKDIEYFQKMREAMKEEMTSTLCADYDQNTETKCAGIETHASKDENMDDKSLAIEMKKVLEKIL